MPGVDLRVCQPSRKRRILAASAAFDAFPLLFDAWLLPFRDGELKAQALGVGVGA